MHYLGQTDWEVTRRHGNELLKAAFEVLADPRAANRALRQAEFKNVLIPTAQAGFESPVNCARAVLLFLQLSVDASDESPEAVAEKHPQTGPHLILEVVESTS